MRVRRTLRHGNINLEVVSTWIVIKGMRLNEITQGRSADTEKKSSEDWVLNMSTFRGPKRVRIQQ